MQVPIFEQYVGMLLVAGIALAVVPRLLNQVVEFPTRPMQFCLFFALIIVGLTLALEGIHAWSPDTVISAGIVFILGAGCLYLPLHWSLESISSWNYERQKRLAERQQKLAEFDACLVVDSWQHTEKWQKFLDEARKWQEPQLGLKHLAGRSLMIEYYLHLKKRGLTP